MMFEVPLLAYFGCGLGAPIGGFLGYGGAFGCQHPNPCQHHFHYETGCAKLPSKVFIISNVIKEGVKWGSGGAAIGWLLDIAYKTSRIALNALFHKSYTLLSIVGDSIEAHPQAASLIFGAALATIVIGGFCYKLLK